MAPVSALDPSAKSKRKTAPGQRRNQMKRWRAEKCVPLQVLLWILGAVLVMPLWLYVLKGVIR